MKRHARRWCVAAFALAALLAPLADAAQPRVLLVVGDSISAGYGLPSNTGWARLLGERIATQKLDWRVVNASISGDTTAGGLARLPALLAREKPALTVIELGGNDGLRGNDLGAMQANLDAMVVAAQKAGSAVLLIGMRLPPNYGNAYTSRFEHSYVDVSTARKVPLVPFFFDGFAEKADLFQADRIHPALAAQQLLLDNVWPVLKPLLARRP